MTTDTENQAEQLRLQVNHLSTHLESLLDRRALAHEDERPAIDKEIEELHTAIMGLPKGER